jgi:muramidase (phage lysozyme)
MKPEPQSGREVLSRDDDAMTQLLEEVINKVKQLGPAEQNAIAAVILAELEHAEWDKQIEQDLKAGKFDKLIKKMREDIAAGRAQPL